MLTPFQSSLFYFPSNFPRFPTSIFRSFFPKICDHFPSTKCGQKGIRVQKTESWLATQATNALKTRLLFAGEPWLSYTAKRFGRIRKTLEDPYDESEWLRF
jgi:hypothetical protein